MTPSLPTKCQPIVIDNIVMMILVRYSMKLRRQINLAAYLNERSVNLAPRTIPNTNPEIIKNPSAAVTYNLLSPLMNTRPFGK